jgi:hypothetical protein
LRAFDLDPVQFWDCALVYAACQIKAQHILDRVDPNTSVLLVSTRRGSLSRTTSVK